jgi:general stress protein 26
MSPEILAYLKGQQVCVFAIEMPDGSPHAATIHFANTDEPVFVFETEKGYRKTEALFGRDVSRATMVVGSNEGDMKTFQMDGTAQLLKDDAKKEFYLTKFPQKRGKLDNPKVVMFTFTPTWWRFTDWTKPEGKTILTSDSKVVS